MPDFLHTSSPTQHAKGSILTASITLASWQLRRTWLLLLVTTFGILAAVLIACAIPLFSSVTTTAGLRNTLREQPTSSEINVNITPVKLSSPIVRDIQRQFDPLFQFNLGPYISHQIQVIATTTSVSVTSPRGEVTSDLFTGVATPIQQAAPHLRLISGRLPHSIANRDEIELLITPHTAFGLGVHVGSTLTFNVHFSLHLPDSNDPAPLDREEHIEHVTAHIVGLFTVGPLDLPYWHGMNLEPYGRPPKIPIRYSALFPLESFLNLLNQLGARYHVDAPVIGATLSWYYHVDPLRASVSQLDDLIKRLASLRSSLDTQYADAESNSSSPYSPEYTPPDYPYIDGVQIVSQLFHESGTPSNLERYRSRIAAASIPIFAVSLQILALLLFFVSLMTDVLVDRQSDALAILRSRGASRGQIFGALLTQIVGLGLFAIVIGMPLAGLVVFFISQHILPAQVQDALNILTNHPVQTMLTTIGYAVAVVLVILLTMSFSLARAAKTDVLSRQREAARATRHPLWQRLNLDVVAGIIALVGYCISLYLTTFGNVLGSSDQTLIVTPLSLIAPFFLVLGCLLLFLRFFPRLLHAGEQIAVRGRGAISMLALAHMARAPRQSVRVMLLLTLATTFALFSLIFTASQEHNVAALAAYQTGADFSGSMLNHTYQLSLKEQATPYQAIPGVLSTSVGFAGSGTVGGSKGSGLTIEVRAVDIRTFAQTATWPSDASSQSLPSLLALLHTGKDSDTKHQLLPVIIDAIMADKLALHTGSTFSVVMNNNVDGSALQIDDLPCLVAGVVQHIPTTSSGPDAAFAVPGTSITYGGILLDYQTYNAFYHARQEARGFGGPAEDLPINYVWLRSRGDAPSLARIRSALNTPELYLTPLNDRYAIIDRLHADPLAVTLTGLLSIGAVATLLVAFITTLLASWSSARTHLTNYVVLRALGTSSRQIATVLTWEQGLVSAMGLLLGMVFSLLLAKTVIPPVIANTANLQSGLAAQTVIPVSLPAALLAVLAVFVIALSMTARTVLHPSMSQTLRTNED